VIARIWKTTIQYKADRSVALQSSLPLLAHDHIIILNAFHYKICDPLLTSKVFDVINNHFIELIIAESLSAQWWVGMKPYSGMSCSTKKEITCDQANQV